MGMVVLLGASLLRGDCSDSVLSSDPNCPTLRSFTLLFNLSFPEASRGTLVTSYPKSPTRGATQLRWSFRQSTPLVKRASKVSLMCLQPPLCMYRSLSSTLSSFPKTILPAYDGPAVAINIDNWGIL
ncbi:hypothetical protein QCA50_008242 [Cerrena zonata]|uniref:Secreted protein n=1 Tax=Cerrena zonata TaxID=2478898 RepID=A0AAW0GFK3_9APHY